jgi:glycosyltransferase involved in cell wall biosynthesis
MAMLNYEISMCNAFDRVVTMTASDAAYLRSYARRADVRSIPIGVDSWYFQPQQGNSSEGPLQILFVGNYRHTPNVEAAEFLLEHIAPAFPDSQFIIAGSYFPATLRKPSNVIVTGHVADARHLFNPFNTIFVAPLFSGTGQRVKLLEAFAMGVPVITTSLGAAGFPIVHGRQALIAETIEEFRSAVSALAASPEARSRISAAGRDMVVNTFSWERIGPQLIDLVEERFTH